MNELRINGSRLWTSLMDLAQIGATDKGGVKRLALTDLDRQGRDLVVQWAKEAGLSITVDMIGNVFMRREGTNPSLPPIVTGSHIDTQPTGGKFDGNYGVLAGLEVVRTLNDLNIRTEAPIEAPSAWRRPMRHATSTARASARNSNASATGANRPRANTRSAPISRPTSSRARCWKTRTR
jgi:hypothetical protein